ncbi:AP-3 complex subunit beta-2 isoform X1 [Maniola jurtina]|uniref:AP-3 complex subunit beta-2 isoform X1 n=1 Tax=Maniola jurtina TaxID=191418 RepID=UPI001E687573|nr:AP-3 complex subunit beta-2 isoform X1 [Maniola jurtina]XP_045775481.1 AP-3 complex subunit beta-2 isoform X1 [Maniola jurtina]
MSSTTSYNNDKVVQGEVEYPVTDPASGAFFQPDYKKNEDLKLMLDGSKDSLKLEAMKRIIGVIAKGRNASDLFPAVVKNVVSKNIEVKKLVYVYLVRYAEEQQDLALLSISTFQRALKDPNQLIRASALRVLSSIRVPMIVPIVMLAIRDSASDMSPYVRKTAAHAIPKLYSLDPDQKEELVAVIDKLLSDKAPLVVGSAAMAFNEVCGDRMSLIHRSYRKLCALLADVDEWGQLTLLNVLTVYAKTCFPDPNTDNYSSDSDKPFYDSDSDGSDKRASSSPTVEPDLRLLLRAAKPLLQSRNAGVVMAVAQLFFHCGPAQELPPVAKALVRLLRAPVEVQSVVLNTIASITVSRRSLFEPFLKSFFVRNSDATHLKLLKLEILTNLATEASAAVVLREYQTYVTSSDKAFVAATIQAIGRLAVAIHTETETCLNGLLHLLSSKDEWVVCEAVVVVKRVVGGGASSAQAAVSRAAKLLRSDRLAGNARAAAVWLVAEHGAKHPRAAAILAHMAANFAEQDELVKLQLLSLAVKLSITQPDTVPLCKYVLSLARYDASYDVRDRARMLRRFIDPQQSGLLSQYAAQIFCPDKPKPTIQSNFKDRDQFTVGSLSQYIGSAAAGYRPLPQAPREAVGASLREATAAPITTQVSDDTQFEQKNKTFYSEPDSDGSASSSSGSSAASSSSEESDEEEETNNVQERKKEEKTKKNSNYKSSNSGSSDSESDSESSSGSESESENSETSEEKKDTKKETPKEPPQAEVNDKKNEKSNLELLLELDEVASSLPTMTPTCGGFLSPPTALPPGVGDGDSITPVGPSLVPSAQVEMIPRVMSRGLGATRQWGRAPHLYSHKMCAIEISFTNHTPDVLENIRVNKKTLTGARSIHEFAPIPRLGPGATVSGTLGVDFADSIQPIEFTVISSLGEVSVSITPPVGELMRSVTMSESKWDAEQRKLRGMTECNKQAPKLEDESAICKRVFETANVACITSTGNFLRFAGRMLSSQDLVLLSVKIEDDSSTVTANCPNMAVASLLANQIAQAFARE